MAITIKGSHLVAALITGSIAWWMYGGEIEIGGQADTQSQNITQQQTIEETPPDAEKLFKVSYVEIAPVKRERTVTVRGRTKAQAIIPIRSETGGILQKRMVNRGDLVKEGDLVCVLAQGARAANVRSAQARLEQAQGEFDANEELNKKGFVTDSVMRQRQFELNAAKAELEQAEIELARTEVKANASGIVQDPVAEPGDVLTAGGTCVTLNDSDPMFFTGQVSERVVNQVKVGMQAELQLVTGETTIGEVTYIAPASDPATRTFAVDLRLDATGETLRDGITAQAKIKLPAQEAIRVSPAWLTLADTGAIGVKTVSSGNAVTFKPVEILSQTNDGFWIKGLEAGDKVITLGQEYVVAGEKVEPVAMGDKTDEAGAPGENS